LIAAYGNGGEQERAESKFKEMLARGLQPDDYTFVGLMICPASRGDYVTCLDIKDRMVAHDVTPTVHIYNEIIRAAGISKKYELAVEIYQTLVDDGIQPNATTRMSV
jgi:pentatricopeptide repeat protein